MILADLTEPFHVTAGYTGKPGGRTFYLQAEDRDHRVTLKCEKIQVDALAHVMVDLLAELDDEPASDWDHDAMALRPPIDPVWTIGEIRTGYHDEKARFVLELTELPDEVSSDEADLEVVRIWMDRDQARRFAAHAIETVAEGRPRCQFCGRPQEDEGHVCPSTNGHGRSSR